MRADTIAALRDMYAEISATVGLLARTHEASQTPDLREQAATPLIDIILRAGYRAQLLVPLLRSDRVVGALIMLRRAPGEFARSTIDLLKTFAAQSVLAIQNARLFAEIENKSRQLELANTAKSRFLAMASFAEPAVDDAPHAGGAGVSPGLPRPFARQRHPRAAGLNHFFRSGSSSSSMAGSVWSSIWSALLPLARARMCTGSSPTDSPAREARASVSGSG